MAGWLLCPCNVSEVPISTNRMIVAHSHSTPYRSFWTTAFWCPSHSTQHFLGRSSGWVVSGHELQVYTVRWCWQGQLNWFSSNTSSFLSKIREKRQAAAELGDFTLGITNDQRNQYLQPLCEHERLYMLCKLSAFLSMVSVNSFPQGVDCSQVSFSIRLWARIKPGITTFTSGADLTVAPTCTYAISYSKD